jgi:hypothetical protein
MGGRGHDVEKEAACQYPDFRQRKPRKRLGVEILFFWGPTA